VPGILAWAAGAVCLMLVPGAAAAQRISATLDVGGANLEYADSVRANAFSVSPALNVEMSAASIDAAGTVSLLGSAWSTNGAIGAAMFTPRVGMFMGEASGTAGGSVHEDGTRTGEMLVRARLHMMSRRAGAWAAAGAGRTSDASTLRSLRQFEAGTWGTFNGATAVFSLTPTAVDDTLRYLDSQASIAWAGSRIDFNASAGFRSGDNLPAFAATRKSWGSVSVAAWLKPWLALVGSAGTYPVDLTQGYPGGQFATLAVRLRARNQPRPAQVSSAIALNAPEPTLPGGTNELQFEVAKVAGERRTLRVRAPGAGSVEINADFTGWQPVRLTRAQDAWWSVTLVIPSGLYQMNLRVNGGKWIVPPGLTSVADEFGGAVGVLSLD
jgi:hypothetical protein